MPVIGLLNVAEGVALILWERLQPRILASFIRG